MGETKAMDDATNEALRAEVRLIVAAHGGQEAAAEAIGVGQGYLSEFLSGKRGAGSKILRGLGRLDSQRLVEILEPGRALEPVVIDPKAEAVARSILRKRGWTAEEVDAAKAKAVHLTPLDAANGLALADAWELPLLGGRARPAQSPQGPAERQRKRRRPSGRPGAR